MTLPMKGQGLRQTSSSRFREEVLNTQLILPFLFLILVLKEAEATWVQGSILAGTKVIQASVTTPDNFNEIIKIRSLILYVTVVQDFEREKKKKKVMQGQTKLQIHLQLASQKIHVLDSGYQPARRAHNFKHKLISSPLYSGHLATHPILFPCTLKGTNGNTRLFLIFLWNQQSNQLQDLRDCCLYRLCSEAFCCRSTKHIWGSVCPCS